MKKHLYSALAVLLLLTSNLLNAATLAPTPTTDGNTIAAALPTELSAMSADQLVNLTPAEYKKITGKRLGLKKSLGLKLLQKKMKKMNAQGHDGASSPGIDKNVYIILAIFIPFLAVGLATNFEGNDWLIALILNLLFWLPAVIYAFIKMGDYYGA